MKKHIKDRVDDDVDKLLDLSHKPGTNFLISSSPNNNEQQQHCNSTSTRSLSWSQSVLSSANNQPSSSKSIHSILNYCDKITPKQNKAFDVLLARAIYATSAPLHLVDNSYCYYDIGLIFLKHFVQYINHQLDMIFLINS